jgi:hypothetical protein
MNQNLTQYIEWYKIKYIIKNHQIRLFLYYFDDFIPESISNNY